jgi:hypothetical protein
LANQPPITPERVALAEHEILEQSKRIDFFVTEYSVELLATKMREQEFVIPSYQREDTWEPARKSRFIESLLMGLPIPFLFFWEMPDTGKLEIVDGSQRLRTIQQFLDGTLTLGKLESLPHLEGFRFTDLLESRQRKVRNRSIRGIVLNEHADAEARFDLFERINTGSKIANPAEVRRGALTGPFRDLIVELANNELFNRLAPSSESSKNLRAQEELVTRFFAYGDGLVGYKDRVAVFLFDYVRRMNREITEDATMFDRYKERFMSTMQFVENTFPNGFRRRQTDRATRHARFEAIAVGSFFALRDKPSLRTESVNVEGWLASAEFAAITRSDSANVLSKLKGRLEYVRQKLIEA